MGYPRITDNIADDIRKWNTGKPAGVRIPVWGSMLFRGAQKRAMSKKWEFNFKPEKIRELITEADGKCMLTSIPFSLERPNNSFRRPFGPSLDRIDRHEGYVLGNVRLVCIIANYAMNEWGGETLKEFMRRLSEAERIRELDGKISERRKTA